MINSRVAIAFEANVKDLGLEKLMPFKQLSKRVICGRKFKQVRASLEHIGLVEPLIVFPSLDGKYLVLNGNLRFYILKEMGVPNARCIIATDDEAYTYNKYINGLSPIDEHGMILKAIKNGVPEARIAAALAIDMKDLRRKRKLLDGICSEATALIADKRVSHAAFQSLRKMQPIRQIEAVELMLSAKQLLRGLRGCDPERQ